MKYGRHSEQGFTLIELMIAVLLGLIISAAAAQVYIMSIRTGTAQRAAAGILDANVYGLQHIEKSLRLAGIGLDDRIAGNSVCSGVLIAESTAFNDPATKQCMLDMGATDVAIAQHSTMWTNNNGIAPNTNNQNTPQLTIQYRAPVHMRDCEGKIALGPRRVMGVIGDINNPPALMDVDGQVVVERYFVRKNGDKLELRCDAGRYVVERVDEEKDADVLAQADLTDAAILKKSKVESLGDDGTLIISDIDDFQLQLGVNVSGSNIQYQTITDYLKDANSASKPIVAIKMAVLAKGAVATIDTSVSNPQHMMFGKNVTVSGAGNHIRRVYETNTMLRNGQER